MLKKIVTTCLALAFGASVYAACPADWSGSNTYDEASQVTYKSNVYTAKRYVPYGTSPADGYFWAAIASCKYGNINYDGDLQVGSTDTPQSVTVFGDVNMKGGNVKVGASITTYSEATQSSVQVFNGGEGGGNRSKMTSGQVYVGSWSSMGGAGTTIKPSSLVLHSAGYWGSSETEISAGSISTPKLYLGGVDVQTIFDDQQAVIDDLTARIEALERK